MTAHICSWCKSGLGNSFEETVENEILAIIGSEVSHGICEACEKGLMMLGQVQEYVPCLTREHIQSLMEGI